MKDLKEASSGCSLTLISDWNIILAKEEGLRLLIKHPKAELRPIELHGKAVSSIALWNSWGVVCTSEAIILINTSTVAQQLN